MKDFLAFTGFNHYTDLVPPAKTNRIQRHNHMNSNNHSSTLKRNKEKRDYTERIFCPVCSTPNRGFTDEEIYRLPKYQQLRQRGLLETMIRQANYVDHRPYGRNTYCPFCNVHFRVDLIAILLNEYLDANQYQNTDPIRQLIFDKYA